MKVFNSTKVSQGGILLGVIVFALLLLSPVVAQSQSRLTANISPVGVEITADLTGSEIISADVASPEGEIIHSESETSPLSLMLNLDAPDGSYRYDVQLVNQDTGEVIERITGFFFVQHGQAIEPAKRKGKRAEGMLPYIKESLGQFANAVFDFLVPEAQAGDLTASDAFEADVFFDVTDLQGTGNDFDIDAFDCTNPNGYGCFDLYSYGAAAGWIMRFFDSPDAIFSLGVDGNGDILLANYAVFIDRSAERLGIGYTAPSYTVDAIGDRIRLRNNTTGTAKTLMMRVDGAATDLQSENADLFIQSTPNTNNIHMNPFGGNVNIGSDSTPAQKLDVNGDVMARGTWGYMVQGGNPGFWLSETAAKGAYFVLDGGVLQMQRRATNFGGFEAAPLKLRISAPNDSLNIQGNGYVGFGTFPAYPIHSSTGARLTVAGVWTNGSSREYKENIQELSADEAMVALKELNPITYSPKADPEDTYLGFIAEDVPEIVAMKDRKGLSPMDIVAVLTKVSQEQQKVVQEQQKALQEHQKVIKEQQKTIEQLTKRIMTLEKEVRLKGTVASLIDSR